MCSFGNSTNQLSEILTIREVSNAWFAESKQQKPSCKCETLHITMEQSAPHFYVFPSKIVSMFRCEDSLTFGNRKSDLQLSSQVSEVQIWLRVIKFGDVLHLQFVISVWIKWHAMRLIYLVLATSVLLLPSPLSWLEGVFCSPEYTTRFVSLCSISSCNWTRFRI